MPAFGLLVIRAGPRYPVAKFYADIVAGIGSDDGREVAVALDRLREEGPLDRDGRYALGASRPGSTGIVGALYPDPNEGA